MTRVSYHLEEPEARRSYSRPQACAEGGHGGGACRQCGVRADL